MRSRSTPSSPPARNRGAAVRAEFGALATAQARLDWINGLGNAHDAGFKLRTAVIMMLTEGGTDDWETLSRINRVDDGIARDFARSLAQLNGTPKVQPHHAAALVKAARAAGLTAASEADILALFAPGKPAGTALAEAVAAAPALVTPQLLQSLAAGVLRAFSGAIHDGVASAALSAPEADFPPEARAYEKAGNEPWKADALVVAVFGACGDDAELRAHVLKHLDRILVGGNAQLRSEASVRADVAALAANFAELRQLAANDPELLRHGRDLLDSLHGKGLPNGLIGRLVQTAREQPMDALKGLPARSKGMAIHKAVSQFYGNIIRIGRDSGVGDALGGEDEAKPCRAFLVRYMLASLSPAVRAGT